MMILAFYYTVFRVGRITPHPDHRNLRKQAKKIWDHFWFHPDHIQPDHKQDIYSLSWTWGFFGKYEKKIQNA